MVSVAVKERLAGLRAQLPAMFFFGGFLWDTYALGRGSKPWDLWLLLGYSILSALVLTLIGRGVKLRRAEYFNWILQFCYGGTLASLTVLYFISAGTWTGWIFVFALTVVLVANEFLERRYGQLTISLTMFTFSIVMYLNFALPHVFRSVRPLWFYVSTAIGLALGFALRRFAKIEQVSFKPSLALVGVLVLLFVVKWIPPVPLVTRDMAVCRNLDRTTHPVTARIEAPPWWYFWKHSEGTVHHRPGEKVWCYTAIYLPHGIEAPIAHVWYYHDPERGWVQKIRVPVTIHGGREDGFRAWSYSTVPANGTWNVRAETANGQVIGSSRFEVVPAVAGVEPEWKQIALP